LLGVAWPVKEEAASDADFRSSHPMVADGIKLIYGRACKRFGMTSGVYDGGLVSPDSSSACSALCGCTTLGAASFCN
jgi:hypothetical protein